MASIDREDCLRFFQRRKFLAEAHEEVEAELEGIK
jgi:hypothetical protein